MPKAEEDFLLVRKYLTKWVTDIVLSNASGYFDINRISEGTALKLLNLIFGYELIDLNIEKFNYPGIDLGDTKYAKVAFQITSQSISSKIVSSLKTFRKENYKERFPNGIKFFIINNKKKSKKNLKAYELFSDIFDPETGIIYPQDLIEIIKNIYYQNEVQFTEIKKFLIKEFGENSHKELISFETSDEKMFFYKKVFNTKHLGNNNYFVHFSCIIDGENKSTENIAELLDRHSGLFLIGPSGCGKSSLSKNIALSFCKQNVSVILESKYYDTNINTLLNKEICNLGFKNSLEFFELLSKQKKTILLIIDGFNECDDSKKAQLIAELEKINQDWAVKFILSSQKEEKLVAPLELLEVKIPYPSEKTKIEIASKFNKSNDRIGLISILKTVSTSLEAKMIGEMEILNINNNNRFSLFENFIKQKLESEKIEAFSLMSIIAGYLSSKLSFTLSEREIEKFVKEHNLLENSYKRCLESQILDNNLGQVSFAHEMFFNFFVAENIIRFSGDIDSIIKQINLPRNYDNKLFIVGSISEINTLEPVLSDIRDVDLLRLIILGEAGNYAQKWCKRKLNEILDETENEINSIRFVSTNADLWGIGYLEGSLTQWTPQQLALINLIPYQISEENIIKKFYEIVGKMDDKITQETHRLRQESLNNSDINVDYLFSTAYVGQSNISSAVTKIISNLHSGILIFDKNNIVSAELISFVTTRTSFTYGQFYFILLLLRWNEKLSAFFQFTRNLLEKNWKQLPYHLKLEILVQIRYFPNDNQEKNILIGVLHNIHQITNNVWMSSTIFDALNQLGALDQDAQEHIPFVSEEINELLARPNVDENCKAIFGLYNRTYDHPYSYAYQEVISNLDSDKSKIFYEMAVKGMTDVFLGSYLILETENIIGSEICPSLVRWTEVPISNISMSQDSLQIFIISHLILAKYNYPLISRLEKETDLAKKSLFAVAEIYYWFNRSDMVFEDIQKNSKNATNVLFNAENPFIISAISEIKSILFRHPLVNYAANIESNTIENWYADSLVNVITQCLRNLDVQKSVTRLGNDVNIQAIDILQSIGSILDVEVLKTLAEHNIYGKPAVKAIKALLSKT